MCTKCWFRSELRNNACCSAELYLDASIPDCKAHIPFCLNYPSPTNCTACDETVTYLCKVQNRFICCHKGYTYTAGMF